MDGQENIVDTQQSSIETAHNNVPQSENLNASFNHSFQAPFFNPEHLLYSKQFAASQIPFYRNYGLNQVPSTPPHEPIASGYFFQGLLNAPINNIEAQMLDISDRYKKSKNASNGSKKSHSTSNSYRYWTNEEDVALTKAYLYVTVDAIVGKDQSSVKLWDRILKIWRDHMGTYDEKRGSNSLSCRWNTIQMAVGKFHALYESLERTPRSGTTITDMKKEALNMYRELGDGTPFKFEHCWEIMKDNPKWCSAQLTKTGFAKKAKIVNIDIVNSQPPVPPTTSGLPSVHEVNHIDLDSSPTENTSIDDGLARPMGRKASKEKRKRMNEQSSMTDVLNNLQSTLEKKYAFDQQNFQLRQEMLKKELELKEKNQQIKEKAQKMKQQERILNTDLSKLQPMLRLAYEKMQGQILKEWEEAGLFGGVPSNDD